MRLIASLGRVELQKLRTGRLAEQDWPRIASAITLLNQKQSVYIDDTPALTPTDLRARARRLAREHGLSLIVIDYLQLMKGSSSSEREPRDRDFRDLALAEGAGQGARRADHRALAAEPRARAAPGQAPGHVRPSRVRDRGHPRRPGRRDTAVDRVAGREGTGAAVGGCRRADPALAGGAGMEGRAAAGAPGTARQRALDQLHGGAPPARVRGMARGRGARGGRQAGDCAEPSRARAERAGEAARARPARSPDRARQLPEGAAASLLHRVGGERSGGDRGSVEVRQPAHPARGGGGAGTRW